MNRNTQVEYYLVELLNPVNYNNTYKPCISEVLLKNVQSSLSIYGTSNSILSSD